MPVRVHGGARQIKSGLLVPTWFEFRGRKHRVGLILKHWHAMTAWEDEPRPIRIYWEAMTDTKHRLVLYHDLLDGAWYVEKVYE